MLRRLLPPVVVGAMIGDALAATTLSVAPVTLPKGSHGVDGPFFPSNHPTPVVPSTGMQLEQQAHQRVEARLGGNSVLSDDATVTKARAQTNKLGFITKHFDQIDTAHTGRASMSDVRQYLQTRQQQQQRQ
jgi:hypothetical protein